MTFSWATIRVRNLEDSLAFYHNLLGLPIHDRFGPPGHQIVMLGTDPGTKLELIESAEPLPEVPAPGLSLGFAPENMRKLLSTLEAAGISCPPPMSPNPSLRFYFIQDRSRRVCDSASGDTLPLNRHPIKKHRSF